MTTEEAKRKKELKKYIDQIMRQMKTKVDFCKRQIKTLNNKVNSIEKKGRELVRKADTLKRELNSRLTKPTRANTIQRMLNQQSMRFNQLRAERESYLRAIVNYENRIREIENETKAKLYSLKR